MAAKRFAHLSQRLRQRQYGAALVEFAIVFLIFITLVFAIIEFTLAVFQWSRMVEATRAGARFAITNDPACDVFDNRPDISIACSGGILPGAGTVSRTLSNCPANSTDPGCRIVAVMRSRSPLILSGGSTVTISYTHTETGDPQRPEPVPLVTVSTDSVPYHFMLPGLFGIDATITMPGFQTTRVGEDLYTLRP